MKSVFNVGMVNVLAISLYIFAILLVGAMKPVVVMKNKTIFSQNRNQFSGSAEEEILMIDHANVVIVTDCPVGICANDK